jgi:hypothetical protein
MEPKPRHVHIGNCPGCVKPRENVAQLHNVFRHYAARVVFVVEAFESLVADRADRSERNALRNGCQLPDTQWRWSRRAFNFAVYHDM